MIYLFHHLTLSVVYPKLPVIPPEVQGVLVFGMDFCSPVIPLHKDVWKPRLRNNKTRPLKALELKAIFKKQVIFSQVIQRILVTLINLINYADPIWSRHLYRLGCPAGTSQINYNSFISRLDTSPK